MMFIMKSRKNDICINITLHNEGDILYRTFRSIAQNIDEIVRKIANIRIQINIHLDKPDELTKKLTLLHAHLLRSAIGSDVNIYENDFGDLARSRNFLLDHSYATYIQFFDGDDLFSYDYLSAAYEMAVQSSTPAIYCAQWLWLFDDSNDTLRYPIEEFVSSTSTNFDLASLYSQNPWPSQMLVHYKVYEDVKYIDLSDRYRSEEYNWVINAIAIGYQVKVVPKTIYFYRQKSGMESMLFRHYHTKGLCLAPTQFFRPSYFAALECPSVQTNSSVIAGNLSAECSTSAASAETRRYWRDKLRDSFGLNRLYWFLAYQWGALRKIVAPFIGWLRHNYVARVVYPYWRESFRMLTLKRVDNATSRVSSEKSLRSLINVGIDKSFWDKVKRANEIEPYILVDTRSLSDTVVKEHYLCARSAYVYCELCKMCGREGITDIVLIPRIVQGGADKAMIDLVAQLTASGRKVLVVATQQNEPSSWRWKFIDIKGCWFIERDRELAGIRDDELEIMLLRIIQNWPKIHTLTVMNSLVGYSLVDNYSDEIHRRAKIFVHSWMYYYNDLGYMQNPFPLDRVYRYLDCLITDGVAYKKQLIDMMGVDGNKIRPVYLKINPNIHPMKKHRLTHRILYAGRIARQKRVDLIVDIAGKLKDFGVAVDFYGTIDYLDTEWLARFNFKDEIDKWGNLSYKGTFNDFAKLPLQKYDAIILPTRYEGMPNVVLEAMKANMFVIVGKCGSISTVIADGINGVLVKDNGSACAYLGAIKRAYKILNSSDAYDERLAINKSKLSKHSDTEYAKSIAEIYEC